MYESSKLNFVIYRYTQMAFVLIGLSLLLLFKQKPFWFELGIGMLIRGALMLSLDFLQSGGENETNGLFDNWLNIQILS
jgi:hypothetical protein